LFHLIGQREVSTKFTLKFRVFDRLLIK
jgi:hypothetical protein